MYCKNDSRTVTVIFYFLFFVYFVGCVFGVWLSSFSDTEYYISDHHDGFLFVICECLIYHAAVVMMIPFRLSILMIPFINFVRGAALTGTFYVLQEVGLTNMYSAVKNCSLSAVLQLPALFYLSALGIYLRLNRMFNPQKVNHLFKSSTKRDLLFCNLLLVLSVIIKLYVI